MMVIKRRSPLRLASQVFLGILLFIVLTAAAAILLISTPYFCAKLGTFLTHHSGRNVALSGRIETHLFSREPRIAISNVKVGNAEWGTSPTMFQADRIEVVIIAKELLKGRIVFEELRLDAPKLVLEKNMKGDANWNFTDNAQAAVVKEPMPSSRHDFPIIRHLEIKDGEIKYIDPKEHISSDLKTSTVNARDAEDEIELKGTGTYQNHPFLLDISGDSVLQLRGSNKPYNFTLSTTVGGTSAEAKGTIQDPVKMEAMDVELKLKGRNAADLFPITGIALPPTPPYNIKGHLVREGIDWKFQNFSGQMGSSDLKGNILWHPATTKSQAQGEKPYFKGDFVSENLDMKDLAGFVGAHDKPADNTRVIPDAPLDISRLLAMNADVTFTGQHIKAPDLLKDFYMNLKLDNGVLTIAPVTFSIGEGKIIANVSIEGLKDPPPVKLDVTFKRISLESLFAPLAKSFGKKNVSAGVLGGKAEFSGEGKSLRDMLATSNGTIGIGMEGGQLSHLLLDLAGLDVLRSAGLVVTGDEPVNIKCVVGNFDVKSGIGDSKAFLIDTDVTTIQGKGTINLKNEAMDLHFTVHPKELSLVSARSPLHVKGTFKHPDAGVDVVPLATRGGAAALLALLAPPAALLAFIEPGLGQKSDCAGFIQRMQRDTGSKVPVSKIAPAAK